MDKEQLKEEVRAIGITGSSITVKQQPDGRYVITHWDNRPVEEVFPNHAPMYMDMTFEGEEKAKDARKG